MSMSYDIEISGTGASIEHKVISAPRVGNFNIYVQGNLKHCGTVILTVHDLGCNHTMWDKFLSHTSMSEITKRVAWIHVDIPGQEDGAHTLPSEYKFPSMQTLGEDLVCILDQLGIKQVVGLGEGAGANILVRFAMAQPNRIHGVCLIHCTGTAAGFMEAMKDKIITWKLHHIGMNPTAEAYLVLHRFGSGNFEFEHAQSQEQLNEAIELFQNSLRSKINAKNLKKFVDSFLKRSNITDNIARLRCPVLMMTGNKASFNHTVHRLYAAMSQKMEKRIPCDLLEFDGVANVLEEKAEKVAESFLYFAQGLGTMAGIPMPRVRRQSMEEQVIDCRVTRPRSKSMEEADRPTGFYTAPTSQQSPQRILEPIPSEAGSDDTASVKSNDVVAATG